MKSVIAAIVAIAATVVSAQAPKITTSQPGMNQVLTAGTTAKVVWDPVAGTIVSIDLRKGSASALSYVSNIATNVDASKGSYDWAIDATLAAGTDYALSFGQSPDVSYTPFFTIKSAGGAAAPSSNSSAAVSPAAPATSPIASTSIAPATTKAAAASTSAVVSASATPTTPASSGNKNVAAVGVAAVAGAVVAALI